MQRPSFVLFDLGNVLVHIHPEAFLQLLGIDTPDNRRYYQSFVNAIVFEYERGETSTEQFLTSLEMLFNARDGEQAHHDRRQRIEREEIQRAMLAVIGQPVVGMEELVRRVASNVPVGLLSNTNPLHFDLCMNDLPSLRLIPNHFLSYRLKSLKPNPTIFREVVKILKLAPGDILYIDDMPQNIDGGRNVGLTCHLFDGREGLDAVLSQFDL